MKQLLLFILFVSCLKGDGLYFNNDRTHLGGEYSVLKLSSSQRQQVERSRVIDLTLSQWKSLQQVGKECPKRLQVLTSDYDDCTCGVSSIAVWFRPGELEVPHRYIPQAINNDGPEDSLPFAGLVIDPDGLVWLNEKPIKMSGIKSTMNENAKVYRSVNEIAEDHWSYCYIEAPPRPAIRNLPAIKKLVEALRVYADSQRIHLYIPGFLNPQSD
jgi:hypothetical protein